MTIKEQIYNFVKSRRHPCTRAEIVGFYGLITGKTPSQCSRLATALCTPNHATNQGYLCMGYHHIERIGRNQYIAKLV